MDDQRTYARELILPAYRLAEASRLTGAKRQTIASWFKAPANQGRDATRHGPLLKPKTARKPISFLQLSPAAARP